jgi:LmbE family N-acetylglucosaminyl deacetylase
VLVVVAHPDDESFGLGAIVDAFTHGGTRVDVVCLTAGEASTLGAGDALRDVRRDELDAASRELGVTATVLHEHPDGALAAVSRGTLADAVLEQARSSRPEALLTFDDTGVTGHPDHAAATAAALLAADILDLPVLAWTLPHAVAEQLNDELGVAAFHGCSTEQIDLTVTVDRTHQIAASYAHHTQAVPTSPLWRRLELLGDVEHLRWLRPPAT